MAEPSDPGELGARLPQGIANPRGSTIALIAGQNVRKHSDAFEESVPVWVFEEMVSCLLVGWGRRWWPR